jgi:hypothetical protein
MTRLFTLEGSFVFVGILMGILYVIIPVKDAGDGDFAHNPRVRNLLFLGVPVLAMLAAWEKAGIPLNRTLAFTCYVASLGPTILLMFVVSSVGIYFDRRRVRRHHRETFADLHFYWWVWSFLINPARYHREVEKDREAVAQHRKDLEAGQVGRLAKASSTLGLLIKSVGSATDNRRQQLTDELLESISSVTMLTTRTPQRVRLEANYMELVPVGQATIPELASVKFQWPPKQQWTHLLVLRRYTGRMPSYPFALALSAQAPMDEVLLGAPEAYIRQQPMYVEKRRLEFGRRVPRGIQTAVRRYMDTVPFATFVSIPIVHGTGTIGMVNIESNLPYILGESDAVLNLALDCVAPYCSLLGQLLAQRRGPS